MFQVKHSEQLIVAAASKLHLSHQLDLDADTSLL